MRAQVPLAVGPRSHEVLAREGCFQKSTCHLCAALLSWKEQREGRRALLTPHAPPQGPRALQPHLPFLPPAALVWGSRQPWVLWPVAEAIPGEPGASRGQARRPVQGRACVGVQCGPPGAALFPDPSRSHTAPGARSGTGQAGHSAVSASWCCVFSGGSLGLSEHELPVAGEQELSSCPPGARLCDSADGPS